MSITFQKSDVQKAIENSGGIISKIATRLRCDWHTADKYIKAFGLSDVVSAEKESLKDLAESKLIENIEDNDNTAIIFYLKTQAKDRGYVERNEIDANIEGTITVKPPKRE